MRRGASSFEETGLALVSLFTAGELDAFYDPVRDRIVHVPFFVARVGEGDVVLEDDVHDEHRWVRFAASGRAAGVRGPAPRSSTRSTARSSRARRAVADDSLSEAALDALAHLCAFAGIALCRAARRPRCAGGRRFRPGRRCPMRRRCR